MQRSDIHVQPEFFSSLLVELALVAVVLFHTLNGLRLTFLAVVSGRPETQRFLAYAVVALTAIAVLASLPLFVS